MKRATEKTLCAAIALAGALSVLNAAPSRGEMLAATTRPGDGPPTSQPAHGGKVASGGAHSGDDLTNLSLEDLMNVEVYSAAKHVQRAAETPAAFTVVGQEDMRRSGMTTIPDMLRLVPGLDVAQINANQWAIGSRGFNDLYSNKLLVAVDGRSVYSPLFSGVYWDTVDYVLPDLDRIEVVRGPGATLWGANAVDGVINITTKSARETQGWLAEGLGGNQQQQASVRYGGQIDEKTFFRVYSKYRHFENFQTATGADAGDGWQDVRGGFRIDRYATPDDVLTFQSDIYNERVGQTLNYPVLTAPFVQQRYVRNNDSGGNVLARWKHTVSDTSSFTLQAYYDHISRSDVELGYALDTFDIDFQHRFAANKSNEVIWGGDLRFTADNLRSTQRASFNPSRRDDYMVSAFIQDDLTVVPDRLHLIVGTKLEENSYSNFEIEPSARVLFTPNENNTFWGAVSRAVRTPSRWEQDSRLLYTTLPTPQGALEIDTFGKGGFRSEELTAFEVGYRVKATQTLSFDLSGFYNIYNHLRGGVAGAPTVVFAPVPHGVLPITLDNGTRGVTFGAEIAANWNILPNWRLTGSYTWLDVQLHSAPPTAETLATIFEGTSPHNQFQIRSYYDIIRNLELNTSVYYTDNLKTGGLPSRVRADAGLTWRPREFLSMSVGIQNIFDNQHSEFRSPLFITAPTEMPRTYYARLDLQY